jgi:molybdopterin converting factor small subunit
VSIRVRFVANTRSLFGKEEADVRVDGLSRPTARDVLVALAESENKDLSGVLRAGETGSWSAIRVVRNGVVLLSLDAQVSDGDVLVLLPLLGAG